MTKAEYFANMGEKQGRIDKNPNGMFTNIYKRIFKRRFFKGEDKKECDLPFIFKGKE